MYGTNEVASQMQNADGSLRVNDVWYTLQGEGPDAGRPAVFVRLSKCNLRCYFCDTEFESGMLLSAKDVANRVCKILQPDVCNLVVITGGEPLLQNIIPFVVRMNMIGVEVAVETAGTVYVPNMSSLFKADRSVAGNIIVCSPKTPKLHAGIPAIVGAFKYIIRKGETDPEDGLPTSSTQMPGVRSRVFRPHYERMTPVYLQAQDEGPRNSHATQANLEECAALCMKHGYRLSVQTHKLAGVP